ncbi:MAG: uracil-DNA glycosylase [Candidatus Limnocylindrales bacterium]
MTQEALGLINAEIVECMRCPRLVRWRQQVALDPPARFAGQRYWARPVPGFGDPAARVSLIGLAPAAHGGNRTGRVFTGDRSGDFLFPVLHETGFANQPTSTHVGDELRLIDLYISAVNRCAPPDNKPTPGERDNCLPYLVRELRALQNARMLVCLGAFAWDGALRALGALGHEVARKPRFGHGAEAQVGPYTLLGTFHPSQQNTFTGRLTSGMFLEIFIRARSLVGARGGSPDIR